MASPPGHQGPSDHVYPSAGCSLHLCFSLETCPRATGAALDRKLECLGCYRPRVPNPVTSLRPVRNQAAQQEVSRGRASKASTATPHRSPALTLLPEPSPTTPPSVEKLSSTRWVPGAKRFGDRCYRPSEQPVDVTVVYDDIIMTTITITTVTGWGWCLPLLTTGHLCPYVTERGS